jgi:hypothetical protein
MKDGRSTPGTSESHKSEFDRFVQKKESKLVQTRLFILEIDIVSRTFVNMPRSYSLKIDFQTATSSCVSQNFIKKCV